MPIIFIHGVNTRKEDPDYREGVAFKIASLKACFENLQIGANAFGKDPHVVTPYWGDLATEFRWGMASLPAPATELLGAASEPATVELASHLRDALGSSGDHAPLLALARKDLDAAVEIVGAALLEQAAPEPGQAAALALAVQAVATYSPRPAIPSDLQTDEDFFRWLNSQTAMRDVELLGVSSVFAAVGAFFRRARSLLLDPVLDGAGDFVSTQLLRRNRAALNGTLGRFFGDVFVYLDRRKGPDAPGDIPKRLLAEIDAACLAAPTEPVVIVGHSLGGVITFDLLQTFRKDLSVDLFVSVGSQVAHFEEMKLFRGSDPDLGPPQRAVVPTNIKRWINVYDEVDIFAYSASRVFDRVAQDLSYDTRTYVIKAHAAYFKQSRFYRWLRTRIQAKP